MTPMLHNGSDHGPRCRMAVVLNVFLVKCVSDIPHQIGFWKLWPFSIFFIFEVHVLVFTVVIPLALADGLRDLLCVES